MTRNGRFRPASASVCSSGQVFFRRTRGDPSSVRCWPLVEFKHVQWARSNESDVIFPEIATLATTAPLASSCAEFSDRVPEIIAQTRSS